MRTHSLALVFAASLLACSSDDEPAPTDQAAAIVPATPAPATSTTTTDSNDSKDSSDTNKTKAASGSEASDKGKDEKKEPEKTAPPPPDNTDDAAFAEGAQKLNDCLSACTDAACASACLSDLQANLPAKPGVQGGSSMCCAASGFFICHDADNEAATCDANADNPGPNCQPVPAMNVVCQQQ